MVESDTVERITVLEVPARPTLVVAAVTTWPEFGTLWPVLSRAVWDHLQSMGIRSGCRNVMLYLDDVPHVEVGVELSEAAVTRLDNDDAPAGPVRSTLPAGRVATTVHRGPYEALDTAHRAIRQWCAAAGQSPAGPRWEIYGPHRADPAELFVEISYLLA